MNLNDIENKLNELFSDENIQIITWYDEKKEFVEDIHSLNLDNVEIIYLNENNFISTKYYINESINSNFLIYAPFRKEADENNYLADIIHYSYNFSPDKMSLIQEDLEIPSEFKAFMKKYDKFWNSNERINDFRNLNINKYSEKNIVLGILSVLTNQKVSKFDNILREVIIENIKSNENRYIESFKKYNIFDDFWDIVNDNFTYTDEKPNINSLLITILLNYTYLNYNGIFPKRLEKYLVTDKNSITVFLDNFMNNTKYSEYYNIIEKNITKKLHLNDTFKDISVDDYINCDTFSLFDKNIIEHYIDLLLYNEHKIDMNSIFESRKTTHFFKEFYDYYNLLKYANLFIESINKFKEVILPDDINDIIKLYTNSYSSVDKNYRKFYYHYDKIEYKSNKLEELRQLIEDMYSNSFLNKLNVEFDKKLMGLNSLNDIGIEKQWNFYKRYINPSIKKQRTVVIISDAFRYGCALELKEIYDMDPTRKVDLKPMISTIPSYTRLGMSCLLPNKEITYENDNVLVNNLKTRSTIDRENILKSYNKNSKAIAFDDIKSMKMKEIREYLKDTDLIYIYHNQIDARGDEQASEHEVFNAVEDTFNEITKLIKKLTNEGNIFNYYITADHGFIYKRDKLEESEKVDLNNLNNYNIIHPNRRFILTTEKTDIPGSLCFALNYLNINGLYVTVPYGVDVFKLRGAGINYVHGGATLQECIIPLMHIKTKKGLSNLQEDVQLQLITSNKRITNYNSMLTFYQKENISPNVTPVEYSLYFIDEEDNKISNEVIIFANVNSKNAEDREFKEKFTLRQLDYSKNKKYYLLINKSTKDGDIEIQREEFMIDIAFQDGFTFN